MSQDWLSRLRDSDSGWDQPAFPDRFGDRKEKRAKATVAPAQATTTQPVEPQTAQTETHPITYDYDDAPETENGLPRGVRIIAMLLLGALALGWVGIVIASGLRPDLAERSATFINLIAVLSGPLVLIGGVAYALLRRRETDPGAIRAADTLHLADQAAQAAARLSEAHAQVMTHTRDFTTVADQSASAILGALQTMSTQTGQLEQSTTISIATLTALGERIATMTDALPRLEDRLATLGETLARVGGDLGQRHDQLDQQLQSTALIAEEARLQLVDAGSALAEQLGGLRDGARDAGDELASLSELSSARLDLTLDRVKQILDATEQRMEAQNAALVALVEKSRKGIETASGHSLDRFAEHCRKIEAILGALDARIEGHAEKSNAWLEGTARGVTALAGEFNALEQSAIARTETLSATMMQLSGDTRKLVEAIESGHAGSDQLINRAEALLVALDSGVRELDESMPAAIGRVEVQIDAMHERIVSANPVVEAVEAVAKGVVSQLQESDHLARAHVAALTEAMQRSQGALAAQKQQIDALAAAVDEASAGMARLGESVGPQMVEALVRVRETADAAAAKARAAMTAAIPDAAAQLGAASSRAVEQAVSGAVSDQLERLSLVADDAVKAAHRATDKLTRQMLSLTDASKELERILAGNAERIASQDRDLMAHRSAKLIASLNERAIDVNKWLDKEVSEPEWTAYLKGDQGLFARRATRLVSGSDAKNVHALYNEDPDFREHVNRYVHDFESLLRAVMASKDGSALALTMVSSDIGKLYVALAQAIERLRSH
ncbi:hypothetical protein [Sphingobium nicotianae]|uniref:ATPase n=1 Tax=Sphingobium nicotianae TaxID=2782607 RepID=A0A9X1D8L0_9SPHN|nr:hypothetical protein [Sphingobium nicotianae]MBT2185764.1 hypothetical protein [Sphingobium nicotianae]